MVEIKCLQCGKICKRNRRHSRQQHLNRKFCSNECRILFNQANKKSLKKYKCAYCGKTFSRKQSTTPKYCSRKCASSDISKKTRRGEVKKCEVCGKKFYCTRGKLNYTPSRFCSTKCMGISQRLIPNSLAKDDKRKQKSYLLKSKYGITIDDYERMFEEQGGKCWICKQKKKKLSVDHNHKTGKVRALLCTNCNTSLGKMKDSIQILENAISYLKKYS